jgi:phosphoglycerate kinase
MQNPDKPCMFLFGGAKFSDIIVTIERVLQNNTADHILLTGLPANAFLKAKGYNLGETNEELLKDEGTMDTFHEIRELTDNYEEVLSLPVDFAVERDGGREEIRLDDLPSDPPLYDIGSQTITEFITMLKQAKTIFLSGPCGVFENPVFMKGTEDIFRYVAQSEAFSIVGGGHTVAAVTQLGLEEKFSHISTGGGALEKFMMGEKLPAIEALKMSKQKHVLTS